MAKKTYAVLKAVKVDGVELGEGDDIQLEAGQAEGLVGVFVELKAEKPEKGEKAEKRTVGAQSRSVDAFGKGKNTDGL